VKEKTTWLRTAYDTKHRMLILVWEKIWLKRLRFGEVELAMGVVFQHSALLSGWNQRLMEPAAGMA